MSARSRVHKPFKRREAKPKRGGGFTPSELAAARMLDGGTNVAAAVLTGKRFRRAMSGRGRRK